MTVVDAGVFDAVVFDATAGGLPPSSPSIVSVTRTKISRVPGYDQTEVVWTAPEAFTGYQFRVVAAETDPVTQGVQIEANQSPPAGGSAGVQYTATITDDEVEAADPAESPKLVKLFIQNANGWSP